MKLHFNIPTVTQPTPPAATLAGLSSQPDTNEWWQRNELAASLKQDSYLVSEWALSSGAFKDSTPKSREGIHLVRVTDQDMTNCCYNTGAYRYVQTRIALPRFCIATGKVYFDFGQGGYIERRQRVTTTFNRDDAVIQAAQRSDYIVLRLWQAGLLRADETLPGTCINQLPFSWPTTMRLFGVAWPDKWAGKEGGKRCPIQLPQLLLDELLLGWPYDLAEHEAARDPMLEPWHWATRRDKCSGPYEDLKLSLMHTWALDEAKLPGAELWDRHDQCRFTPGASAWIAPAKALFLANLEFVERVEAAIYDCVCQARDFQKTNRPARPLVEPKSEQRQMSKRQRLEQLEADNKQLRERLDALTLHVDPERMDALTTQVEQLTERFDALAARGAELEAGELECQLTGRVHTCETRLDGHEVRIDHCDNKLDDVKASLDAHLDLETEQQ